MVPERYSTKIVDVSKQGVGLLCNAPMSRGKVVTIRWQTQLVLRATVIRCVQEGDNWRLGCTLERELTDEELAEITGGQSSAPEQ